MRKCLQVMRPFDPSRDPVELPLGLLDALCGEALAS